MNFISLILTNMKDIVTLKTQLHTLHFFPMFSIVRRNCQKLPLKPMCMTRISGFSSFNIEVT